LSVRLSDFTGFPIALRRLVSHEVPVMAFVRRVSDADTLVVFMDRRFSDSSVKRLRLRGVNAEEVGTPKGDAAAVFLQELLPSGSPVVVTTYKVTYDRFEADVKFLKGGKATDVADELVKAGHAVRVLK